MQTHQDFSPLLNRSSSDWLSWFQAASANFPELNRALFFLKTACALVDDITPLSFKVTAKQLRQAIGKFLGQSRVPSEKSSEKLAVRIQILQGWFLTEQTRQTDSSLLIDLLVFSFERLIWMCEGVDDKTACLLKASRSFTQQHIPFLIEHSHDSIQRTHLLYPLSMQDHVGLMDAQWWWKRLADGDRTVLHAIIAQELDEMVEMQPSVSAHWHQFDKRWRRLRLKSLLEYLEESGLLAELLRKSAVDGPEAALAIDQLRKVGRSRDAIIQAEQWMRTLPHCFALARVLFDIYTEDGCDQEALNLAVSQYQHEPSPIWLEYLQNLGTKEALEQLKLLKKEQ
jgi:hypothetical protein